MDCLDLPKRLRQLSLRRTDGQRVGPMRKQIVLTRRSLSQWELSEAGGAGPPLYSDAQYSAPDATLQDF